MSSVVRTSSGVHLGDNAVKDTDKLLRAGVWQPSTTEAMRVFPRLVVWNSGSQVPWTVSPWWRYESRQLSFDEKLVKHSRGNCGSGSRVPRQQRLSRQCGRFR